MHSRRSALPRYVLALIAGTGAFYFVLHNRAVRQAEEQTRTLLAVAGAANGRLGLLLSVALMGVAADDTVSP